ncbi:Phage integrase family protein [Catalinimonas alkaloidigena]|uniref:Phage integrase family protein n=1 Tax=Catalinimonas alkaloidigena TaxID=1075417 RepID=A0A1G9HQM5_9BACT|nr:Phage integrase family protein [Catalinimonas alkaloidigena]
MPSSFTAAADRYEQVLGGTRKAYRIERPRKEQRLPVVLSQEEAQKLLQSVDNLKHKCILMLTYSAGLRIGELLRLQLTDLNLERKQIHIKGGKGKKDRGRPAG